jgi:hypothetical protein
VGLSVHLNVMEIEDIERLLEEKKTAHRLLFEERRTAIDYLQRRRTLTDEILELERALAAKRDVAHAVAWPLGDAWYGLAEPVIFGNGSRCAVIFATRSQKQAVLLFDLITAHKLEDIGDEVIEAHPLQGRGLASCRALIVKKSSWMEELRNIDATHPQHYAKSWEQSQHYMLCFKDSIVEVIAQKVGILDVYETLEEATQAALSHVMHPQ